MTELEQEIDEIMKSTMTAVGIENKENHTKILELLEQSMYDSLGDIEESHIYGMKEVAQGAEAIEKAKKLMHPTFSDYIDATEGRDDKDLPQALVGVVHFGSGNDVYEPLTDTPTQVRMAEVSDGLIIRCPMRATRLDDEGKKQNGIITVLISDGHISACARLFEANTTVINTFAISEYKLGENKLTDAVYLAYTVPQFLKKYATNLYNSLVAFNEYRDGQNDE